jgi:hypothetical protein
VEIALNLQSYQNVLTLNKHPGPKASCVHVPEKLLSKDTNLTRVTSTSVNLGITDEETHCQPEALRSTKLVIR